MKLWIMSDLHLDVRRHGDPYFTLPNPQPEHNIVIVAGDVREKLTKGLQWIGNAGFQKPVILVHGNHCMYRVARDRELEKGRALARELSANREHPIHLLQDDKIDIGGVRFIGSCLFTDYRLHGEHTQRLAMLAAESGMNDHKLIRLASKGYRKWRASDALAEHERSRWFIEHWLAEPWEGRKVVVTHHAPSIKSYGEHYNPDDLLNASYASHLDELVDRANLWIHGHTHVSCDYKVGDGRVVSNQRGYATLGEQTGFDANLVIEI